MRRPSLPLLVALFALVFLASSTSGGAAPAKPSCKTVKAPQARNRPRKAPTKLLSRRTTYDVVVDTSCGSFTIRLDQKVSPKLAASFVALVRSRYFDGTIFHRIVPGFVIQGGDPTQSGAGGPGYSTVDAPPASLHYTLGVVAMAKTGAEARGTSGSQFFVVTAPDVGLAPDYALLGRVTKGIDVAQKIGKYGPDPSTDGGAGHPTKVIVVDRMRVQER